MPTIKISHNNKDKIHFITCTVQKWYHLFRKHNRCKILYESLDHCQVNKGLEIFSYVFMYNHIHMIVRSNDLIRCICDFKKYTSQCLMENIRIYEPELESIFTKDSWKYSIWIKSNMPKIIESEKYFLQKRNYIEQNPMRKWYIDSPDKWYYSSANPNQPLVLTDMFDL